MLELAENCLATIQQADESWPPYAVYTGGGGEVGGVKYEKHLAG